MNAIISVRNIVDNFLRENPMQGYRTMIAAFVQFTVAMGMWTQADAEGTEAAILAIVSAVSFLATIYFKVRANIREMSLKYQAKRLIASVNGEGRTE